MSWVDTNIFVGYLAQDDPAKTGACLALFRRVAAGEEAVTTSEAVLAEVVYVLSSRSLYGVSPREIAERPTVILRWPGMRLPQKRVVLRALDLYAQHRALDFEDALSVAHYGAAQHPRDPQLRPGFRPHPERHAAGARGGIDIITPSQSNRCID